MIIAPLFVHGMDNRQSADAVKTILCSTRGVNRAEVSFDDQQAVVEFDEHIVSIEQIALLLTQLGYRSGAL